MNKSKNTIPPKDESPKKPHTFEKFRLFIFDGAEDRPHEFQLKTTSYREKNTVRNLSERHQKHRDFLFQLFIFSLSSSTTAPLPTAKTAFLTLNQEDDFTLFFFTNPFNFLRLFLSIFHHHSPTNRRDRVFWQ